MGRRHVVAAARRLQPGGRRLTGEGIRGLSYVLPLRRWHAERDDELIAYVGWLAQRVETIVVDGSDLDVFAAHHQMFGPAVRHMPVDSDLTGRYGKVNGVVTGVRAATHEQVLIADDDVRYDEAGLERMSALLEHVDLVRPQNYFDPLPWHAKWDTARSLVNRAFGADYPGTLGVRRSRLLAVGGYDGDCLFENLELIRTVEVAGGRVSSPLDFYVRRLPPPAGHFWSQRVRQAYDDFALPARMAGELAVVPVLLALARRGTRAVSVAALLAMATAETGRRRAGGATVFPATCSLMAPAWLAERGVCAWLAVWDRLVHGGVPYAGTVLSKAANSRRVLGRRLAVVRPSGPSAGPTSAGPRSSGPRSSGPRVAGPSLTGPPLTGPPLAEPRSAAPSAGPSR